MLQQAVHLVTKMSAPHPKAALMSSPAVALLQMTVIMSGVNLCTGSFLPVITLALSPSDQDRRRDAHNEHGEAD